MKKINDRAAKYDNVLRLLIAGCFLFIFAFFIMGNIVTPDLGLFQDIADVYDNEWTVENEDGSIDSFVMPTSLEIADCENKTIKTILPEMISDGTYLAITTGKSYKVYVEGNEIYSFDNTVAKIHGKITKPVVVPIPLKDSYSGKELTMVLTNGDYGRNMIHTAYIGSMMGIMSRLIKNSALQFSMAILLAITSLITSAVFAYIGIRNKSKVPLIHLSQGILIISLWIIFNSHLFQLVFRKYFFDGPIGFMLVITMALPFTLYFDRILGGRYHAVFAICECVCVTNFVVCTILHMSRIVSYYEVLTYIDGILLVYILAIIVCIVADFITRKNKEHINVFWGLLGFGLFSFLEVVVTILNAKTPFKFDISGLAIIVGMIVLLFFAILDQIKAFELIRQETQNAIAATKAKSDFLANMSHEIRTPINAIMGMNEMVLRECEQENIKEYASDISSASETLLNIVNDILDFSKIESGKLEIINDEYDLGELIYDVTTLVNTKAVSKGLKLNVNADENLPSKLYGDDKRVREIITNILNNAVKYTDNGYVSLNISGAVQENTFTLNISIEDSGQGIKEEDIEKIFDGFSQVNLKKNKKIEGTGLGLAITKNLIELMGGSIKVDSEFGKGTVFTVTLPQQIIAEEKMGSYLSHRHASVKSDALNYEHSDFENKKILVVDDTPINLKVISKFLGNTKAEVKCVLSGAEMLELIQKEQYDIILLDHMMPDMDGIETLKASKALQNNKCINSPVIALTANAIVGAKEMYVEAGFDDYLSKPVNMETLCNMLGKYLNN